MKISFKKSAILLLSLTIFIAAVLAVQAQTTTLFAELSANPSTSATAPLNDVDLTASVSGTATGDITYKFDCTNDGSFDRTVTTGVTSFTAVDLCDYQSPGNFTAKMQVTRGGLTFQGITAIVVQAGSALSVTLSANPSSGNAPLNDVDLTASVSGTATGDITYKFDCTNDGSFDRTVTTGNTSFTASDLCDYQSPGNFTARVAAERGGLSFQGTSAVVVRSGDVSFELVKKARNITKNQNNFEDTITAEPLDKIEFQIRVISTGPAEAKDIIVKDNPSAKLINISNLKIDGNSSSQNILNGFSIGNLSPNQSKTITFEVQVAASDQFSFGTTDVINTVIALNKDFSFSDAVTLKVEKKGVSGGATSVGTGPLTPLTISLIGTLFAGFILSYVFLFRFYARHYVIPNIIKSKAERDLTMVIERIKKKERNIQSI